jgi:hypothetical protein
MKPEPIPESTLANWVSLAAAWLLASARFFVAHRLMDLASFGLFFMASATARKLSRLARLVGCRATGAEPEL